MGEMIENTEIVKYEQTEKLPDIKTVRDEICLFEEKLGKLPNAMFGDCFPLKHTFATGLYIREITMPKGALLTSKIHKVTHPYFVLRGDVSVITEKGMVRIQAPYSGITLAGTKRALYIHEETVWVTVHKTDETDLEKIEEEIIAKSFDEFDNVIDIATPLMEENIKEVGI
ncbi:MAG TPA: hypothetical protein ACFYD4_15850 [Candidatus Wunengus sp. YC61]|uniref:hypothetical protein n=1 Tax=Candidatus Wunengus sp. YC61 TaxID=3367698 RepID=UPI004028E17A